jgi:hypothetical protein
MVAHCGDYQELRSPLHLQTDFMTYPFIIDSWRVSWGGHVSVHGHSSHFH